MEPTTATFDAQEGLRDLLSAPHLPLDPRRAPALEIHQVWGTFLVDTRHLRATPGAAARVSPRHRHRWEVLGADVGPAPSPLRPLLGVAPWSEVPARLDAELFGAEEALLFEVIDGAWHAVVDHHAEVERDGVTEGRGPGSYPVAAGERWTLTVGGVDYHARLVPEGRRVDRAPPAPDYPMVASSSSLGFLGALLALFVFFAPPQATTETLTVPERTVELLRQLSPEPEPTPEADPEEGGQRAPRDEGQSGAKRPDPPKARGGADTKRSLDRQVAESAGALGGIESDPALAALFGSSALGATLQAGAEGLIAAKGAGPGRGGLGARGGGLGGGGDVYGGTGVDTRGLGSGDHAYGKGPGGEKSEGRIRGDGGDPLIVGSLDRALIDEVVKKHMAQLRYCYQREVTKDPSLQGKVVTQFTIAKAGDVSAATTKSSSVGNSAVDHCVRQVFLRMNFPEPRGGGIVIVSYPLMFSL